MDVPKRWPTHFIGSLTTAVILLLNLGRTSSVLAEAPRTIDHSVLRGLDLSGRLHRFGERSQTKVVVAVFLSTECPICTSYLTDLGKLASMYRRRGVEVYGITADVSISRAQLQALYRQRRVAFPILFDASGELRAALSPTHVPQVYVLNERGEQLYSGAIDDRDFQVARGNEHASRHFLGDAIEAALAGQPIDIQTTKPIGHRLEEPVDKSKAGNVTFTRDIAPIMQAHCASCHRPGQSGPFSLLTYNDVSRHARQIAEVTKSRFMPPWKPAPDYGRFLDERRLSEREISMLEVWASTGKPEGNQADLPIVTEFVEGWRLGQPDKILRMREMFHVPASGPDIRQYFVIPTRLTADRLITAIDFHPGTPQAIHHASFYLDTNQAGRRLDDNDPEPGYRGFGGPGFLSAGTLRSWFPGMSPRRLPKGMGRRVPRGSDIVAEIHYVCTGKAEHDRSEIGLYYAPQSARQLVVEVQVGNKNINIPAGAQRHHERASYTVPVDTTVLVVSPHMHVIGREIKVAATLPDGTTEPLVWIKDWDFNWQSQYSYAEPVHLPQGSRIDVDAWFDNSTRNPLNPSSPPRTVVWGEGTTDEMLICNFQCTCASMDELQRLVEDYERYFKAAQTAEADKQAASKRESPVKRRPPRRPFR
jgi:hypothetical protein